MNMSSDFEPCSSGVQSDQNTSHHFLKAVALDLQHQTAEVFWRHVSERMLKVVHLVKVEQIFLPQVVVHSVIFHLYPGSAVIDVYVLKFVVVDGHWRGLGLYQSTDFYYRIVSRSARLFGGCLPRQ